MKLYKDIAFTTDTCLKLINYFLAALGLHCCPQAFFSCGEQGNYFLVVQASHCSGFSCCGAQALEHQASVVVALGLYAQTRKLWHMGLVAPQHMESSWTRDRTCISCTGRLILNHWTTREVLTINTWPCSKNSSICNKTQGRNDRYK